MLSNADHKKIVAAYKTALSLLSVPAVWTQTKAPKATKPIKVGFKNVGDNDTETINAYGIDAIKITIDASDFTGATKPEKFDTLTIDGIPYVLDVVRPHRVNGEIVLFKSIIRGD